MIVDLSDNHRMIPEESIEVRCKIDQSFGLSWSLGKQWMDAARCGDLKTIRKIIGMKRNEPNAVWRLVHYNGQGTSYGFIGSTALHWAAANGDIKLCDILIEEGVSVNYQNHGGSTALHSAVSNQRLQMVEHLLMQGASPTIVDCCGDSPSDIARGLSCRGLSRKEIERFVQLLDTQQQITRLQGSDPSTWSVQDMRAIGEAFHVIAPAEVLERNDLVERVSNVTRQASSIVAACTENDAKASSFMSKVKARHMERQLHPSTEDDVEENAILKSKADAQKDIGNRVYASGDYTAAIKHYTTAIALFSADAAYYSNRSACYLALGRFAEALKDARASAELKPDWAKAYHRMGSALMGLGRFDDAVHAFRVGLQYAPNDSSLQQGAESAAESERSELLLRRESMHAPVVAAQKKPWFDCKICENKTRDRVDTPCCQNVLCGTCWKRRNNGACPYCSVKC